MQSFTNKNKNKIKIMFSLILDWLGFFFFVEVRVFTVVLLKTLAFSPSKNYFIYFTTVFFLGGGGGGGSLFVAHMMLKESKPRLDFRLGTWPKGYW